MFYYKSILFFCFVCVGIFYTSNSYAQKTKLKNKVDSVKYELKCIESDNLLIQANLCKNKKDYTQALELYYNSYSLQPQNTVALYEIAGIYRLQYKYNDAIKILQKAIKKNSQKTEYFQRLAELYEYKGEYEKQIEQLQKIAKLQPNNLQILYTICDAYYQRNQSDKALAVLQDIENKFGLNEVITQKRFYIFNDNNDYEKSEKQLVILRNENPFEYQYSLLLSSFYIQNGKYNQAKYICDSLEGVLSNPSEVYLQKALLFKQQDLVDSLVNQMYIIYKSAYISDDIKLDLLQNYIMRNQSSDSIYQNRYKIIQKLYELVPENNDLHSILAEYYMKNNDKQMALPHLYYAIKNEKSNISLYNYIIDIELINKNWDSIISVCNQAKLYFPNNPDIYISQAYASMQVNKFDSAINVLHEGLEVAFLKKQKRTIFAYLGESYFNIDSISISDEYFKKSIAIDSLYIPTLLKYSYSLALQEEKQVQAKMYLQKCKNIDANTPEVFLIESILYSNEGNFAQAKIELENNKNKIEPIMYYEYLGDILFLNNSFEEAYQAWNKANELGGYIDIQRKKVFLQKK